MSTLDLLRNGNFSRILSASPKDSFEHYYALYKTNQLKAAILTSNMILKAQVYYRLGEYEKALEIFSNQPYSKDINTNIQACRALSKKPVKITDEDCFSLFNVSVQLYEQSQYKEALKTLNSARELLLEQMREEEATEQEISQEEEIFLAHEHLLLKAMNQDPELVLEDSFLNAIVAFNSTGMMLFGDDVIKLTTNQKEVMSYNDIVIGKLSKAEQYLKTYKNERSKLIEFLIKKVTPDQFLGKLFRIIDLIKQGEFQKAKSNLNNLGSKNDKEQQTLKQIQEYLDNMVVDVDGFSFEDLLAKTQEKIKPKVKRKRPAKKLPKDYKVGRIVDEGILLLMRSMVA
jgi:tetratricopeptide (TPR) repeat protein